MEDPFQRPDAGGEFRHTQPIREKGTEDHALYDTLEGVVEGNDDIASTFYSEEDHVSIFFFVPILVLTSLSLKKFVLLFKTTSFGSFQEFRNIGQN